MVVGALLLVSHSSPRVLQLQGVPQSSSRSLTWDVPERQGLRPRLPTASTSGFQRDPQVVGLHRVQAPVIWDSPGPNACLPSADSLEAGAAGHPLAVSKLLYSANQLRPNSFLSLV